MALRPDLPASDFVLLLLYQRGARGAEFAEFMQWVRPSMRTNLRRTLDRLVNELAFARRGAARYYVTRTGNTALKNESYCINEPAP